MSQEYKHTLNLPETQFQMKAELSKREPAILEQWEKINLYQAMKDARVNCPQFILHDGPPYANGDLHAGHILNKVLKDIVNKSKHLSGYLVPYVPGWDCHGLPIELIIEKKHGKAFGRNSHVEFRKACREYAASQVDNQRKSFKRLGVPGDWEHPYLTMAPTYEANTIRSFGKIIENGHLEKGLKPVHWCMECGSALAEAEVEYQNKNSLAIDVRFQVVDEKDVLERFCGDSPSQGSGALCIPIWTTTPWTLPANQAVALAPEFTYVLVECRSGEKTERLVLVEELLETCLERYSYSQYKRLGTAKGSDLEGVMLQHPFYSRKVPVILGDHVTLDTGTGSVHTAPGHGLEDYEIGMRYGLKIDNPVDDHGCFFEGTELFEKQFVLKADPEIVALLEERGKLLKVSQMTHSYPHCWRHKTPLIFRVTTQWFISMGKNGLRAQALEAIQKVRWIPDWGQSRIESMISNRPDWCISRQRLWGVPIALFVHKKTGELHPDTMQLLEKIAQKVENGGGVEVWFDSKKEDWLQDPADEYEQVMDTLDVWMDSGVSHECVLRTTPGLSFPADLYLEGSDQHRGWFQSSLMTAIAIHREAPYRTVLTHGFTVDAMGRKLSKSLGNYVSPHEIINSLGADVLRLWVGATDYRTELAISNEILKRNADMYRRIRNTARFLLANLHGFDPKKDLLSWEQMLPLDRFIVSHAFYLQKDILEAYETYQFHLICQRIHHFCSIELGSFYLDIIKDRQYTMGKESVGRRSAQTALYYLIEAMVRWLAPILSFTAEEIWQYIPGEREKSVFLTRWYEGLKPLSQEEKLNEEFWQAIIQVKNVVNKHIELARTEGVLGSGLEAEVTLYADERWFQILAKLKNELRFVLITSQAVVESLEKAPPDVGIEIEGLCVVVKASDAPKCIRCWHRRKDIGLHAAHPELCERCVTNIEGNGEERHFA